MKQSFLTSLLLTLAAAWMLGSCHIDGTSYNADEAKGYAEAVKLIMRNVDLDSYKIYEMKFETSRPEGNKLETVTVKMVSDVNKAYSQKFMLTGAQVVFPVEGIPHAFDSPLFEEVKGIDLKAFDAKQIEAQVTKAKALVPKEGKFQAVYNYCISETVPTANELEAGFDKWGEQHTSFLMSFSQKTPDGKKGYVEVGVVVDEQGEVKLNID